MNIGKKESKNIIFPGKTKITSSWEGESETNLGRAQVPQAKMQEEVVNLPCVKSKRPNFVK
jgi:hypothetical protein